MLCLIQRLEGFIYKSSVDAYPGQVGSLIGPNKNEQIRETGLTPWIVLFRHIIRHNDLTLLRMLQVSTD